MSVAELNDIFKGCLCCGQIWAAYERSIAIPDTEFNQTVLEGSACTWRLPVALGMGPVSIQKKKSFLQISQSLEASWSRLKIVGSIWNVTGVSAATLWSRLLKFEFQIDPTILNILNIDHSTRLGKKKNPDFSILKQGPASDGELLWNQMTNCVDRKQPSLTNNFSMFISRIICGMDK